MISYRCVLKPCQTFRCTVLRKYSTPKRFEKSVRVLNTPLAKFTNSCHLLHDSFFDKTSINVFLIKCMTGPPLSGKIKLSL